jgi:hypothetical protein
MTFPGFKFFPGSKIFWGSTPPDPPIHPWYIEHTRGLQPLLSPSNILSHRKVPFQKMPPHGKILKKGPALNNIIEMNYIISYNKSLARFGTIFGGGGGEGRGR